MKILKSFWETILRNIPFLRKTQQQKQEALRKLYAVVKEASQDGIITAEEMQEILKLQKKLGIHDAELTAIKIKVLEHIIELIARDNVIEEQEMDLLQTIQAGLNFDKNDLKGLKNELVRIKDMYWENKLLTEEQASPIHKQWWEQLSEQWKEIFKESIFLENEPNEEELIEIIYQKELVLTDLDIEDFTPLQHLPHLTFLNIANNAFLTDLEGISKLKNLRQLDCSKTYITSISPLAETTQLEVLNLNDCSLLKDFNALAQLKKLKVLRVNNTPFAKLALLKEAKNLEKLYCNDTAIFSLKPLEKLENLTIIHLKNCSSIESLQGIENLLQLKELDISGTNVRYLDNLALLKYLSYLNISYTKVNDLQKIGHLKELTELHCAGTFIEDLKPLLPLEKLQMLNIKDCLQIKELDGIENKPSLQVLQLANSGVFNKDGSSKEIHI